MSLQEKLIMTSLEIERTFVMIKPDAIERGLIGNIIQRFEKKGFQILALQILLPTKNILESHYSHLSEEKFFLKLIEFMLSGPVITMIWQGKGIINYAREKILGETDPLKSAPGTIRGDLALDIGRNLCHISDSPENAEREIAL